MTMSRPTRHGEGFLQPIPETEVPQVEFKKQKQVTVCHSESGRHHVLVSDTEFEVAESGEDLFARLFAPATMTQTGAATHNDLTLTPGIYRRFRFMEYDPVTEEVRKVYD
jgi:hypothetical protein